MAEENKELTQQELSEQNRIRREKLAQMQEAGKDPFQIVKYDVTHHSDEIRANFDALENKDVCIAGRLMSKRIMGKASFCNIQVTPAPIRWWSSRPTRWARVLRNWARPC